MYRVLAATAASLILGCGTCFAEMPGQTKTVVATVANIDALRSSVTVVDFYGRAAAFDLAGADIRATKNGFPEFRTVFDIRAGDLVEVSYTGEPPEPDTIVLTILPETAARYRLYPAPY